MTLLSFHSSLCPSIILEPSKFYRLCRRRNTLSSGSYIQRPSNMITNLNCPSFLRSMIAMRIHRRDIAHGLRVSITSVIVMRQCIVFLLDGAAPVRIVQARAEHAIDVRGVVSLTFFDVWQPRKVRGVVGVVHVVGVGKGVTCRLTECKRSLNVLIVEDTD